MESKHEIERYFFSKLIELYPRLPEGIITSPEPPDFVIETGSEKIAIEITQIHNEKGSNNKFPPAQIHATEDLILEKAKESFFRRKGIPLHVRFHFSNNIILNKKQIGILADHISNLIEREVEGQVLDGHFSFSIIDDLPEELIHISGYYFHNITDVSWYSAKGRFLPNLSKREILNVVKRKEDKIGRYRSQVDKAILVIAEGLIPNSWFDEIEAVEPSDLISQFDKIFIIRNLTNQLIELK